MCVCVTHLGLITRLSRDQKPVFGACDGYCRKEEFIVQSWRLLNRLSREGGRVGEIGVGASSHGDEGGEMKS